MLVAITGASGSIGTCAVPELLKNNSHITCRILYRPVRTDETLVRKWKKEFGDRISLCLGDVRSYEACLRLVKDADFVLHLASLIPPTSDHNPKRTKSVNHGGTVNIVKAIIDSGNTARLIFFSSVAAYGHRTMPHIWGRVGDPLMPSVFDVYGATKVRAEREILESELKHYVILRETGVLYDNLMTRNLHSGLMFQTPVNTLIEWVTAKDTAVLLNNIIAGADIVPDFWNQVYNIGGGISCRETGFNTYDNGFRLLGKSAKNFFDPKWHPLRNFHCFWFSDSDILENLFHFRSQSCEDFWKWFSKRHLVYQLGKAVPSIILKSSVLAPLLKHEDAPLYWVEHQDEARMQAWYGGREAYDSIPDNWDDVKLLCEQEGFEEMKVFPDENADADDALHLCANADSARTNMSNDVGDVLQQYIPVPKLSHGYDETKPDSELTLEDMKEAAAFRGGRILSESMTPGDLRTKLTWQCHNGHTFKSSPYTILKAGHWCPECCAPKSVWQYDLLAEKIPFYAQIWYDSHTPDEKYVYTLHDDGSTEMEKL